MEITGRLTGDAEVKRTTDQRELVAFTVVVNDYIKPKNGEAKEFSEFFNCSYWLSTKIADSLLKGSVVTISGRLYLNEYKGKDGNQHANLAFHANGIKVIYTPKRSVTPQKATEAVPEGRPETKEDLPF